MESNLTKYTFTTSRIIREQHRMSIVNNSFIGVQDLKFLDRKIEELQGLKKEAQVAAQVKVKGTLADTLKRDKIQETAKNILERIDKICSINDSSEALMELDVAVTEFGELLCFGELRKLIQQRDQASQMVSSLKKISSIEEQLMNMGLEIDLVENIAKEISELENNTPPDDSLKLLQTLLNDKIQSIKEEKIKKLKESLQSAKWFTANHKVNSLNSDSSKLIISELKSCIILQSIRNKPTYPETWWALDILLEPAILRFNYHFNTNKDTNKISKPEWSFNFIETFLEDNLDFVERIVGDVFVKVERIAAYEIITSLLNPVREKIRMMMNTLNQNLVQFKDDNARLEKNGRLLSHLVFELSAFDQRLRLKYKYNPFVQSLLEVPTRKWIGLTGDVLLSKDDNDLGAVNWLNFEYNLAMKRFNTEILNSKNAFKIDYDFRSEPESVEIEEILLKPTYSAYNLIKLFNNLTSHYKTLSIIKYQLRYLSTIQLNMLDRYAEKMKELMKKFDESFELKLSFGIFPGGINKSSNETSLGEGSKAVEQLTEIYCLIAFVKDNLVQWSEELIFVQLWNAFVSYGNKKNIKAMSMFDESYTNYLNLEDIVMAKYERFFKHQLKQGFMEYVNFSEWSSKQLAEDPEPSSSLSVVLSMVPAYLNPLQRSIAHIDYLLIADKVTTLIFKIYYEYIITNNLFNKGGRVQLKTDYEYLVSQLRHPLCLNDAKDLSNVSNKEFLKISQCVDLFGSIDEDEVKGYRYKDDKILQLRSSFSHSLSSLSNHDLNDILLRFI